MDKKSPKTPKLKDETQAIANVPAFLSALIKALMSVFAGQADLATGMSRAQISSIASYIGSITQKGELPIFLTEDDIATKGEYPIAFINQTKLKLPETLIFDMVGDSIRAYASAQEFHGRHQLIELERVGFDASSFPVPIEQMYVRLGDILDEVQCCPPEGGHTTEDILDEYIRISYMASHSQLVLTGKKGSYKLTLQATDGSGFEGIVDVSDEDIKVLSKGMRD